MCSSCGAEDVEMTVLFPNAFIVLDATITGKILLDVFETFHVTHSDKSKLMSCRTYLELPDVCVFVDFA